MRDIGVVLSLFDISNLHECGGIKYQYVFCSRGIGSSSRRLWCFISGVARNWVSCLLLLHTCDPEHSWSPAALSLSETCHIQMPACMPQAPVACRDQAAGHMLSGTPSSNLLDLFSKWQVQHTSSPPPNRERERELRREGVKFLLAYVKGVDP